MDTSQKHQRPLVHLSLCAGYGGIDLGLERCGIRPSAGVYVEIETFACANLVEKIEAGDLAPGPVFTDLKRFPFEGLARPRDFDLVLSGGFPCQPFSCAGKRAGDDDERHLFPHIKRGIETCQPDLVVLENVDGILSAKLKGDHWCDPAGTSVALHVLRELERVGYRATASLVSASEIVGSDGAGGARAVPHQRKRVFFVGVRHDVAHGFRTGLEGWAGAIDGGGQPGWECEEPGRPTGAKGLPRGAATLCVARPGEPQHPWEFPRVV